MSEPDVPHPQEQGENSERVGPGRPPLEHRWKPGTSGNPGGRPKGSLTKLLRQVLDEADPETRLTYAELVVRALIDGTLKGRPTSTTTLWDRADGKLAGDPGDALDIRGIILEAQRRRDERLKGRDHDHPPGS